MRATTNSPHAPAPGAEKKGSNRMSLYRVSRMGDRVDEMLTGNENGPGRVALTCIFQVELPGIEPATKLL